MYVPSGSPTCLPSECGSSLSASRSPTGHPGVPATGLEILFDEAQGTAVVLQQFESAEDMEAGAKVFSAMDSSGTPGSRASVDMCEVKLERTLS